MREKSIEWRKNFVNKDGGVEEKGEEWKKRGTKIYQVKYKFPMKEVFIMQS